MITCERCNTENIDGSQYCDECGAMLKGAARARKKAVTEPPEKESINPAATNAGGIIAESPAKRSGTFGSTSASSPASAEVVPVKTASGLVASESSKSGGKAPASDAAPHAKLVIHRGRSVGKEFLISDDEIHIGRWDADGGIFPDVDLDSDDPEAKVSRRHARVTRRSGQYYVEDLGSTNGTFINRGRRLLPGDRQLLRDGDEVIVGKTFLRFHVIK